MADEHEACVMLEKWATLDAYLLSQTKVNAEHTAWLNKLSHYIFEDGLNTRLELNKQTASSDTAAVQASLKRLWWGVGISSGLIIALLSLILHQLTTILPK